MIAFEEMLGCILFRFGQMGDNLVKFYSVSIDMDLADTLFSYREKNYEKVWFPDVMSGLVCDSC